jgi:hypothetical protein
VTVAVLVKVYDGIVLAADSATTLTLGGGGAQVYNNANKIFHLHRKHAIAAMTWGMGSIGSASISTLAKDLRGRFMGKDPANAGWALDGAYTVQSVAERLTEMMFDELYAPSATLPGVQPGVLGFLVAGYSSGEPQAEAWQVILEDPKQRPVPVQVAAPDTHGWAAFAQPDATMRLFNGYDPRLPDAIESKLPPAEWLKVKDVFAPLQAMPAVASMPFADAANLARFLVDVTAGYSHYLLGPDTVGGPVEVAGINRHEKFKWISRKHYYRPDLNPREPDHAH